MQLAPRRARWRARDACSEEEPVGDELAGLALKRLVAEVRADIELLQNAQADARKRGRPSIEAIEAWNDVAIFDRFLARLIGARRRTTPAERPLDDTIWRAVAADAESGT